MSVVYSPVNVELNHRVPAVVRFPWMLDLDCGDIPLLE